MSNNITADQFAFYVEFDYFNELPNDLCAITLITGLVSFIGDTIITMNPMYGALSMTMSVSVILIHSGLAPIFKYQNGSRRELSFAQEFQRTLISYSLVGMIAMGIGVPVLPCMIMGIALSLLMNERNPNQAQPMLLISPYI